MNARPSNYDLSPIVAVPEGEGCAWQGWSVIAGTLAKASSGSRAIAIECYPGVLVDGIIRELAPLIGETVLIDSREALLPEAEINQLVEPFVGGDDPVFGFMSSLTLGQFFEPKKLEDLRSRIAKYASVLITGPGAFLLAPPECVRVYADMPRWEVQQRQRRNEVGNLGMSNVALAASLKYKRAFFVDWRVCDRHKKATLQKWDFLLDTTVPTKPKLVAGESFRRALRHVSTRPFRVVPFFDPGPWGGQWMKAVCGLDESQRNYAWCFDCVPEENSLRLGFGNIAIEVPALNLVYSEPMALLGEPVFSRFGAEFPIRFDMLDTMGGGNLSLQVHPLRDYARNAFGIEYTQDESYYLLDAKPGARVYLGRKDGTSRESFFEALEQAQRPGGMFQADEFVATFPAAKHDHFLIPAGTLHCSGVDAMVLEISATPYIFTFKLWDWGRLGLDGQPRPINIARGKANVCWERDNSYVERGLVNQTETVAEGTGWREERTGLHPSQFIETRRHWFSSVVEHDTNGQEEGSVHVINLVEGEAALVESPNGDFEPFEIHYAETFIVPASVGRYRVRPLSTAGGRQHATIKASIRHPLAARSP